MVKLLAERAPAKINLFLRVIGWRADGYHEIDSIFVPVSLADRVRIEARPGGAPAITFHCNVAALADPESNLAVRAARAFLGEFKLGGKVFIDLEKRIPVGAGLGGGSSDAGAVLRMMAALHRVGAPERLAQIALRLGADVPFFLDPQPARVGGVGERITPLDGFPKLYLVIAAPPIQVSTAAIFRGLSGDGFSGPASDDDIRSILGGEILGRHLINDLAPVAMRIYPQISSLKVALEEAGAGAAAMTGSGSAVFGLFASADEAARAAESVRSRNPEATVFATVSL